MEKSRIPVMIVAAWLLVCGQIYAQEHRFMVFFQDKNSDYSVENPQQFLSERAIKRRADQNIPINSEDLPVNSDYIASVAETGAKVFYTTKWLNGALVQTDSGTLAAVSALPFVNAVELVAPGPLKAALPRSDRNIMEANASRMQSTDVQNHMLGVDLMQQEGITGEGMMIAVFDGGFLGVDQVTAFEHLQQNNQVVSTFDFVGNGQDVYRYGDHGTKVLSVIGANNPGVFTGSAYNADFALYITEDVSGEHRIEEYNWIFAAEMADSTGVDIINTSLGYSEFDDPEMDYSQQDLDGMTAAISKAVKIAASKGMVLTVSAGNEGNSPWKSITAPADVSDILTVGAITEDTVKASFSSVGPTVDGRIKPDVVALGVRTSVINRNGNLVFNNGTSFSAPQIAGLAAGVWQANPDFDYLQVIQSIRDAGHQSLNPNNQTGHGIPHFSATKELVLSTEDPQKQAFLRLYPNPVGNRLYVFTEVPLSTITLFIHNIQGQKYLEYRKENVAAATELFIDLPLLPSGVFLLTALTEDSAGTYRLIKE